MNVYYHPFQISTQSNSQGLQNSLGQNVLTLVFSTHMRIDFFDVGLVFSYYLYVESYLRLTVNVIHYLF